MGPELEKFSQLLQASKVLESFEDAEKLLVEYEEFFFEKEGLFWKQEAHTWKLLRMLLRCYSVFSC